MLKIRLVTGEESGVGYVATVLIPPFKTPPDIIVWGSRHFLTTGLENVYKEAFAVVATEEE